MYLWVWLRTRRNTIIKDIIVDYLTNKEDKTAELPMLFQKIEKIMINGFEILESERYEVK